MAEAATRVGLTSTDAAERLLRDGPNVLPEPKRASSLRLLVAQLTHLLALLLWVASVLAVLAGMPELAAAIVAIILLNGLFAFWQEHRADRSAQELRALLPSYTRVVRDGRKVLVEAAALVVGDVVMLEAGDRVAADLTVSSARGLAMDESLVTGESGAVPRGDGDRLVGGSFVVQGDATCLVAATGSSTELAGIAELAGSADRPPSPLTRQLDRVVRVLAVIATATGSDWAPRRSGSGCRRPRRSCSASGSRSPWCRRGCCRRSPCRWPAGRRAWLPAGRSCAVWTRSRPWVRPRSSARTRPGP